MLTLSSGFLPSRIRPNPPTEDEVLTRVSSAVPFSKPLAKCLNRAAQAYHSNRKHFT